MMHDSAYGSFMANLIERAIMVLLGAVLVLTTIIYFRWRPCTEFVSYYVAGQIGLSGQLYKVYQPDFIFDATRAFNGDGCLPWFYPPPFGLFVSGLALMPFSVSYFVFISMTLAGFLYSVRRISLSKYVYDLSIISALPSVLTTVLVGQVSLLNASLIATGSQVILTGRKTGGVAIGLLAVIKPHLAVGVLLFCVFKKKWATVAVSCIVVTVSAIFATIAFGVVIWPAFIDGLQSLSRLIINGEVPISRMTSIFAAAHTLGFDAQISFALQSLAGVVCAFGIFAACRMPWGDAKALGYALLLSFGFSPYVFCYDTTIMAAGASLLLPAILKSGSNLEKVVLLGLFWLMSGYGLLQRAMFGNDGLVHWAVGGFAYLPLVVMTSVILFRDKSCPATPTS